MLTIVVAKLAQAKDGEKVQEGKVFVPDVQGKCYPIYGHYFWNGHNGATTFCNLLGFQNSEMKRTRVKYNVNAMPVGNCKAGEELNKCTGG